MLWHAIVSCIQDTPRFGDIVSAIQELRNQETQKFAVPANRKTLDVLEHKILGVEFYDKTDKLPHKLISGVIEYALPNEGKALARRSTAHNVHTATAARSLTQYRTGIEPDNRSGQYGRRWEVEMMSGRMDRVQLHRCDNVKSSLFEA